MDELAESRQRALRNQGWLYGERLHRIGHPFEWLDGEVDNPNLSSQTGISGFIQNLSMFFDRFETPESVTAPGEDRARQLVESELQKAVDYFVPFGAGTGLDLSRYISTTASVRAQDYAFLTRYCDLPSGSGLTHLDVGPGLGSAAIYSRHLLDSRYIALETVPTLYSIQRDFLRFLAQGQAGIFDVAAAEWFGVDPARSMVMALEDDACRFVQLPSWHAGALPPESVDLVTCCWVLNEAPVAAVFWILSHLTRVVRRGGHVYIRDGRRMKPGAHSYDSMLEDLGFRCIADPGVKNRKDMQGIPRAYLYENPAPVSFDEMCARFLGELEAPVHLAYNRR